MNNKKKSHLLILVFQIVAFIVVLALGICLIIVKHISRGYSLAYFFIITGITLATIIFNVKRYSKDDNDL